MENQEIVALRQQMQELQALLALQQKESLQFQSAEDWAKGISISSCEANFRSSARKKKYYFVRDIRKTERCKKELYQKFQKVLQTLLQTLLLQTQRSLKIFKKPSHE
jgi:hypothetical protein